jgi:hypothetical protein
MTGIPAFVSNQNRHVIWDRCENSQNQMSEANNKRSDVKTRWRERERESDKKTKQNKTRLPKAV